MAAKTANPGTSRTWSARFVQRILLWIVPCALVWLLVTPYYNRLLAGWTEQLVRITERPSASRLDMQDAHYVSLRRSDYAGDRNLYRIRATDLHFHLILTGALFLAVPGVPANRRLENLFYALLATIVFDILLFFFFVKFVYATQLGNWSLQNYGAFARNFWGLGKHMLDLAFKFALPLILWAVFYYREFVAHLAPERLGRRKS